MKIMIAPLMLAFAAASAAQSPTAPPAQKCTGMTPALAPELAAWANKTKSTAAIAPDGLSAAQIVIGKAIDARLSAGTKVHLRDGASRAAEVGDNAGMFAFSVAQAGTYRVALGSGGWVDVLENGKAVESSAHGHGALCSGIVKMIDFPLKAGDHILQIEGSKEATVGLLIARLP